MITPSDAARRLPYIGALDGLRALAVLAVLLYHLDAPWSPLHLRGGFFGVDVFFVLSGYLITSILLSEWRRSNRVSLPNFWVRRARRLLPAVLFLLTAALLYALIVLPDEVALLRGDALASLGYVTNWYLIFHDQSYFESWGRPSLFQHLWSLAIEEQFYLVWPLLFVIGMRFLRLPGLLFALLCAAAGATIAMAALYQPGADPSRIYYGTDTRSAGLLIGSALALVLPATTANVQRTRAWLTDGLGLAGLCVLAYFILCVGDGSALPYRGGFAVVALATAAVIAATVSGRSRVGAALGIQPLVWLGHRSYSIYLWHWPVFMLTRPEFDVSFGGWPLLVLRLAIVAALAEVSYRFVETPVRNGAALRAWRDLRNRLDPAALRRAGVALAGASLTSVALIVVTLWQADTPSHFGSSSSIGMDIPSSVVSLDDARMEQDPGVATLPTSSPGTTPMSSSTAAATVDASAAIAPSVRCYEVYTPGQRAEGCATATALPATQALLAGAEAAKPPRITAIGDSVMLGAAPQMSVALDPVDLHAKVGLQVSEGNEIIRQLRAYGALGDVVVIHLGTNGEFNGDQLAEMMEELKETKLVVFVNLKVPRDWQDNNNHMLEYAVGRYPNARLLDWHAKSENEPNYFWDDRIHLRPEGALVYTGLILGEIRAEWPKLKPDSTP